MTIGLIQAARDDRNDLISARIDSQSPAVGELRIYSGTRPSTGGTVTTLLCTFPLGDPSFGASGGGLMTAFPIDPATIAATGGASWFRIVDGAGGFVCDGSVGVTGSGEDLEFDTTSFVAGRLITADAVTITDGNP